MIIYRVIQQKMVDLSKTKPIKKNEALIVRCNDKNKEVWIPSPITDYLFHFHSNNSINTKMASAYPGFNAFYAAGGWGSNPFTIGVGTGTFQATLDKAFQYNMPYIQLATWNDFGEGSMIEPTRELGYSCLTYLQQKIGVSYTQSDLTMVYDLYNQRKQYKGNATQQDRLTQVFYYLVSLQMTNARNLLYGTTPVTQSPYTGSPISIPGTIEAENFDKGGEGVAYHDAEAANQGGQYRTRSLTGHWHMLRNSALICLRMRLSTNCLQIRRRSANVRSH